MLDVQIMVTVGMFLLLVGVISAAVRLYVWPERFHLVQVTAGTLSMVAGMYKLCCM